MKGIVYRSAALALVLVVAFSALALPVSATDYQSTYNFWNWAYDNSWFLGKAIIGFSAGNVCQVSDDGLHHATTHSGGGGSVDGQRVYNCVCDLCGVEFQAVATDLEHTYETEVYNLPSSSISSDGSMTFDKKWYIYDFGNVNCCSYERLSGRADDFLAFNNSIQQPYEAEYFYKVRHLGEDKATFVWRLNLQFDTDTILTLGQYLNCITGPKQLVSSTIYNYYIYRADTGEQVKNVRYDYGKTTYDYTCLADVQYYCEFSVEVERSWNDEDWQYVYFDVPKIEARAIVVTDYEYVRPDTFAPSFTYEDGDGWQVHVGLDGNKLIDETNLTYYNPVTNTTTNIQNWSYDYSDRSYTVLTDSNNTTTITYGDEYITINEGDNITYNIYYYTAPDSSGDGDSSGSGGSGDDDGGGLLDKIGELIGSVLGGFIDVIGAALGKVIDSLIDLVTLTIDKLVNVINLFGSFGDALGVLWSWLPEEVVTVLVSGVTVIVFASVIKLFMR